MSFTIPGDTGKVIFYLMMRYLYILSVTNSSNSILPYLTNARHVASLAKCARKFKDGLDFTHLYLQLGDCATLQDGDGGGEELNSVSIIDVLSFGEGGGKADEEKKMSY